MTVPVCPACRESIALDAHACPRCGLAVRPTCSSCGEALEVRMHACPRCWEVIEQPPFLPEAAVLPEAGIYTEQDAAVAAAASPAESYEQYGHAAAAPTLTQDVVPVSYEPAPPAPPRRRRRFRPGRVLLIGIVAGILVTMVLMALEAVGPRLRGDLPGQVELVRQGLPDLDFAIRAPSGWDHRPETIEGRPAAAFLEPARTGIERGLRVVLSRSSFDDARREAEERAADGDDDYDEIAIIDGIRLDDRDAFRHLYVEGEEYREEWWVERGSGTFRIEFWSPVSHREESAQLYLRIARSFEVL